MSLTPATLRILGKGAPFFGKDGGTGDGGGVGSSRRAGARGDQERWRQEWVPHFEAGNGRLLNFASKLDPDFSGLVVEMLLTGGINDWNNGPEEYKEINK
jgi:hypothetical protein